MNPFSAQLFVRHSRKRQTQVEQFGLYKAWWLDTGEPVAPEDWAISRLIRTGEPSLNEELEIECFDGSHKIMLNSAIPLLDEQKGILGAIIINQDITERKQAEAELAEVRRRLDESRESERLYLAQELHDVPMQELIAAEFALNELAITATSERQQVLLATVQERLRQANESLRMLCNELRPPVLVHYGLPAAIEAHARDFRRQYPDLALDLTLGHEPEGLTEPVRLALFRIYQQALSNVVKHAAAHRVAVQFETTDDHLLLQVEDDGCGFVVPERWVELARENHFGIVGSIERADHIGGLFNLWSAPGRGTTVSVIVPLASLAAPRTFS